MLALTSTSFCDVCLDPFGQDPAKAPYSLQCGHVFCFACLHAVNNQLCPLCRTPFKSYVKLHLDVEVVPKGSPTTIPLSGTQAEQEARRFLSLFDKAANRGCSESDLKGIIDECKAFLSTQLRPQFSELRLIQRLMGYLCEVKLNLQSQTQNNHNLEAQINQLRPEKEDLERRIREVKMIRKSEKKAAHATETALREHCSRAHKAYETVVGQYNFVVCEWMRLQELMQMPPTPQPELATPDMDMEPDLAKTPQPRFVAELDQSKLRTSVVQDPDPTNYLISPLPQFTGELPHALPLPDEDEPQEKPKADQTSTKSPHHDQLSIFQPFELPPTRSSKCDAAGHPYTCNCEDICFFSDGVKESESRRPPLISSVSTPVMGTKVKSPSATPSITSPATLLSPGRNRSYTIPSSHTTPLASRAPSPKPRLNGSHSSLQSRETESLKSRLHDLLQDNVGTSSSLPNMSSSHFPSSLNRGTPRQTPKAELSRPSSRPPSSGGTPPQHQINPVLSPRQGESEYARVSPSMGASSMAPTTPSPHPVPTPVPTPVISRASNAAMAMEKERKEKKEQERERRRAEKEKKRLVEQDTLGRSNSVSSSTSASIVSSSSHSRSHAHSGWDTGPYTAPRHTTNASSSQRTAPMPVPSPSIYT